MIQGHVAFRRPAWIDTNQVLRVPNSDELPTQSIGLVPPHAAIANRS